MQVTQVAIRPTDASNAAGRPALTPELLAASGARYSRNNEGLGAILAKIDPQNLDKSVDSIFKMIDYGHQSIADMAPVALFMDGVSMWLAYHIWSLCPTAGGQESSTRYIRLSSDNLSDAAGIGIPENLRGEWHASMQKALDAYESAILFWEGVARDNPEVTRIPRSLLEDDSEKAQKQVARMQRNYAFDRARYFLPAALKTNAMMVQSARAWVSLCQQLLSHPLPEAQQLGDLIRGELGLAAPRLLKHAAAKEGIREGLACEFQCWAASPAAAPSLTANAKARLQVFASGFGECDDNSAFVEALEFHDNRYGYVGPALRNTPVRFGWNGVAFADIRDLNRHRTGSKECPLVPLGFYEAQEQMPKNRTAFENEGVGHHLTARCHQLLTEGKDPSFVYWILLGTQFSFEHTTTADKFIYEAELRTGVGAHYRYAQHLHDVLELWYEKFPSTRGLVLEGSAEPE